jgi:hypothetical protein
VVAVSKSLHAGDPEILFLTTFATPDKTVAQQVLFGVPNLEWTYIFMNMPDPQTMTKEWMAQISNPEQWKTWFNMVPQPAANPIAGICRMRVPASSRT